MADCVCLSDSSVCEPAGCYDKKYKTFLRDMLVTEEDNDNFVPVDDQVQYSEVETCNKKKQVSVGAIGSLTQDRVRRSIFFYVLVPGYENLLVLFVLGYNF